MAIAISFESVSRRGDRNRVERAPRAKPLRRFLLAILSSSVTASAWAGSIGGVVFEDPNRNGVFDGPEAMLPGVRVLLLGSDGAVLRQAFTGSDGRYLFANLADGQYVVSVPPKPGLRSSLPDLGADPAPIPDFPFGRPRYASMPGLAANLRRAASRGLDFRHVALGDSIGFGFNFCGSFGGEDGYIEPTTERLRGATPGVVITDKQAIPTDETADLLDPGISFPFGYNDIFYAIDMNSPLVSTSIGGNDFLGAEGGGDAAVAAALVVARRNLQETFSSLASEIPFADLELNTVYDNLEGEDPLHNVWAPIWDQVLRETAWGQVRRVTVAEVYPEYAHEENGMILGEPELICHDPFGLDGIHPTRRGYDVHEEKLWQSFGGVTLSGDDRLDFNLGFLPLRRTQGAATFDDVTGGALNPDRALKIDGVGALVPSDNREFRLLGFMPPQLPPGADLAQAVLKIRYRTTGAPLDDLYRFEVSIDGTFTPPGPTPMSWNTIIPIVGSSGNDGAVPLAFPDQPEFRIVSAPLYLGAPISGAPTLTWDDLATLSVRVVTTAVGAPDAFYVELDGAGVEIFTSDAADAADRRQGASRSEGDERSRREALFRLIARDRESARSAILQGLASAEGDAVFASALPEVCAPNDEPLIRRMLGSSSATVRGHAVRALSCISGEARIADLRIAAVDPAAGVRRSAARSFAELGEEAPADTLAALAHDADAGVRRIATRALGRLPGTEAALRGLMDNVENRDGRIEAAAALLERGDGAGFESLFEALTNGQPSRRAREALVAHAAGDSRLLTKLRDPDPRARGWAAWIVGRSGVGSGQTLLALRSLLAEDDPAVRLVAMEALARLGDEGSVVAAAAMVAGDALVNVARALARFDSEAARTALVDIAASPAGPLTARRLAARALAMSSSQAVIPVLRSLEQNDDLRIRRLAAAGLSRLSRRAPLLGTGS